jgi:hypothetical protein
MYFSMFGVLIAGMVSTCFAQESLTLPPEEDRFTIEDRFLLDDSPITPDELAPPPAGEFKKVYLRNLVAAKNHVTALLAHLQSKGASVNPLAIKQANALIQGLDKAIATRSLQDAMALDGLYDSSWLLWRWDSVQAQFEYSSAFALLMIHCCEQMCPEYGGALDAASTRLFTRIFYDTAKLAWESEGFPDSVKFSRSHLWLCNPVAVSSTLKEMEMNGEGKFGVVASLNWAAESDHVLPVLRARYQADPGPFDAALAEYRDWALNALEAPAPPGEISKRDVIGLRWKSAYLGRLIELLEHGTTGKNHALFPKLKAYKATVDHLAATAKIVDIKDVVLALQPFDEEWLKIWKIRYGNGGNVEKEAAISALGLPAFFYDVSSNLTYPSRSWMPGGHLFSIYADSVFGMLSGDLFDYWYLWVAKPEDASGDAYRIGTDVFVLFPDQMTERVKSLPLAERRLLLEYKINLLDTPAKYFAVFTTEPEEHPDYVLTRYQANKAEIDAKFTALIQWHRSQPAGQ